MGKKMVVALGGNAILSNDASAHAQQQALVQTSAYLVHLIKQGHRLIVSHGNGPQVGNLLLQQQAADSEKNPAMPLDTCVAMTQGSIGYWLSNALNQELNKAGIKKQVATVLTQVVVDPADEAFKNPTKPIGPFLTEAEAKEAMQAGAIFKEDAGRGWRKVVPSPKPIDIHEAETINTLIKNDIITISCGGGGIPVVDYVCINYGKPDEKQLTNVTVAELEEYKQAGHFAPGSMLPKIEAAIQFVESQPNKQAIITSLENLGSMSGDEIVGTVVTK